MAIRSAYLISAILFLSSIANASPKHWYKDPKWWVGTVVIGAAVAADSFTTASVIHQGGAEVGDPFLGNKPGAARLSGIELGWFGFYTAFHAFNWHETHNDSKGWRTTGYVLAPALFGGIETYAAIHNARQLK